MNTRWLFGYMAAIIALLISGFIILDILGKDTTSIGSWLTLLLSNFVTGAFTLLKVHQVEQRVDKVDQKVNGRMSELIKAKTQRVGYSGPRHLRED